MTSKNHVDINSFKFHQEELDRRVEAAKFLFRRSYASVDILNKPVSLLLPELETLILQGRRLSKSFPPNTLSSLTVYLEKENIEELLATVAQDIETKYREELEMNKEQNKLLLAEQLFSQKKEKEAKALQAKEDKDKAAALAEAEAYFENLNTN